MNEIRLKEIRSDVEAAEATAEKARRAYSEGSFTLSELTAAQGRVTAAREALREASAAVAARKADAEEAQRREEEVNAREEADRLREEYAGTLREAVAEHRRICERWRKDVWGPLVALERRALEARRAVMRLDGAHREDVFGARISRTPLVPQEEHHALLRFATAVGARAAQPAFPNPQPQSAAEDRMQL